MTLPREANQSSDPKEARIRNPFGVMDVPAPDDVEAVNFAAATKLDKSDADKNAQVWCEADESPYGDIEGHWYSRWNGGADPTIGGDAAGKWKQGQAELKSVGERIYLMFDWNNGVRKGLIDARRDGATRLIGKYINLTDPKIIRPWTGEIIDAKRIDGQWTNGRLDFRR